MPPQYQTQRVSHLAFFAGVCALESFDPLSLLLGTGGRPGATATHPGDWVSAEEHEAALAAKDKEIRGLNRQLDTVTDETAKEIQRLDARAKQWEDSAKHWQGRHTALRKKLGPEAHQDSAVATAPGVTRGPAICVQTEEDGDV